MRTFLFCLLGLLVFSSLSLEAYNNVRGFKWIKDNGKFAHATGEDLAPNADVSAYARIEVDHDTFWEPEWRIGYTYKAMVSISVHHYVWADGHWSGTAKAWNKTKRIGNQDVLG